MTALDWLAAHTTEHRRQPVAPEPGSDAPSRPRVAVGRRRWWIVAVALAAPVVLGVALVKPLSVPILLAAAAATGFFNVAGGGGAVLSFTTLTTLGVAALTAHATSQLVTPASFVSVLGSARDHAPGRSLIAVGCLGTVIGAGIVKLTPAATFQALAPYFLVPAAILVLLQGPVQSRLQRAGWTLGPAATIAAMFGCGVYAGLIGVGTGTLALVVLGLTGRHGQTDLPDLLTVRNVLLLGMATVGMLAYAITGLVNWPLVVLLAPLGALGGWLGTTFVHWLRTKLVKRTALRVLRGIIAATALACAGSMVLR